MKTKLLIIAVVAILVNACTTGTYMTKTYDDDIYFSPADVPPVSMVPDETSVSEKPNRASNSEASNKRIVMSQMEKNDDGSKTLNNYIYQPDDANKNSDYQNYNMDQQELMGSDTTAYYNDDSVKYVINNYYDENDNDPDFSYRINRFHRGYYYDPFFYDDWNYGFYSPYYSGYYGWGSGWGYNSWYGGWGYPYSYGYYSPFAFGLAGYYGWGGYYGGYYGGYGGYYGGYYGGGGGHYSNQQIARRRATDINVPGDRFRSNNFISGNRTSGNKGANLGNSSESKLPTGTNSNTWIQNGHERGRSINPDGTNIAAKNATIVNDRRPNISTEGRRSSNVSGSQIQNGNVVRTQSARPNTTTGNVRRSYEPSTSGRTYNQSQGVRQNQNYTPSYNKPRIVNQSSYNNNTYARPRTSGGTYQSSTIKSANASGQTYSEPRSSSTMRQTYRSSSSYSSGSSSSSYRGSSSNYSSPSSSGSYSTPSRSYNSSSGSSSGSYSSGSSSSGSYNSGSSGSSSGGSSSGGSSGGGSGHRR